MRSPLRWILAPLLLVALASAGAAQIRIPIRAPMPRPMPRVMPAPNVRPMPGAAVNPGRAGPAGPAVMPHWIPFYRPIGHHHHGGGADDASWDWILLAIWILIAIVLIAFIYFAIRKWRNRAVLKSKPRSIAGSERCSNCGIAYACYDGTCFQCRTRPTQPNPSIVQDVHVYDNPLDAVVEVSVTEGHFTRQETIHVEVPGEGRALSIQLRPEMRGMVLCFHHVASKGAGHLYVRFVVPAEQAMAITV